MNFTGLGFRKSVMMMPMFNLASCLPTSIRTVVVFFTLLPFLSSHLGAQKSVDVIRTKLIGQQLFLSGQWKDNQLAFDLTGKPTKDYGFLSFTLSGIDVKSVEQKDDRLQIKGQRIGLEFDPAGHTKRVDLHGVLASGHIVIDILAPPGSDYGPAIDSIFAPDLASLTKRLPLYWQGYFPGTGSAMAPSSDDESGRARPLTGTGENAPSAASLQTSPSHLGKGMRAPKILKSPGPKYTEAARSQKLSGNVELYFWVLDDGTVTHIRIRKPLGLGLDEAAVAAVKQYKFAPATNADGTPVAVDLYVDVSFDAH